MLVPIDGIRKDLLKFLDTQRDALSAVRTEIEANWRLQVLMMAFGLAILMGVGQAIIENYTNLNGEDKILAGNLGGKVISFLSLFYFFRFGILLAEYRRSKLTAIVAKSEFSEHCPQYSFMVRDSDSTNSQFEIFFKNIALPSDSRIQQYGILFYIIALTSLMHAVGIALAWTWTGEILQVWKLLPAGLYVVGLLGMYVVHLTHVSADSEEIGRHVDETGFATTTWGKAQSFISSVHKRARWCVFWTGLATIVWIVVFCLLSRQLS